MKANAVRTNTGWIRDLPDFSQNLIPLVQSSFGVQKKSASLWLTCKGILDKYEAGRLTVRQLYYQFVGRGYIVNTQNSYNSLMNTLTKARKDMCLVDVTPYRSSFESVPPSGAPPE